jgi:signal peptidase I
MLLAGILSGAIFQLIPDLKIGQTSGISVEPGLKDGDVVVVRQHAGTTFKAGDVVAFQRDEIVVMHRVIDVSTDGEGVPWITTQGDNNPRPDKPVRASDVEGKLLFKVPWLGAISRALDAGGGLYVYHYTALMLSLSVVLVCAGLLYQRMRMRARLA